MDFELRALLDITLAGTLAAVIGFERERARKPAGLRTHVLVAIAVSLLVSIGEKLITLASENVHPDPMRMLGAITTGVAFLGAGTIVFRRQQGVVEGLTTAASLLLVAAISMAVTVDLKLLGVGVTLLSFTVLTALRAVEEHIGKVDPESRRPAHPRRVHEQRFVEGQRGTLTK